jgi:glycerol uptake facilitator-like aquaporin
MYNYLVEFIGSILLVYVILATSNPLAIGFTYAFILLLTQNLSNGYMNPTVSIVMAATDKLPIQDLIPYCLLQVLGGLIAYQIFVKYKIDFQ